MKPQRFADMKVGCLVWLLVSACIFLGIAYLPEEDHDAFAICVTLGIMTWAGWFARGIWDGNE